MNPNSSFVISQFTNPSGEIVFRLSGWLDGKRIRKNYPTRAEAEAQRQVFDIGKLQAKAGVRAAVTRLTDEQLHEAEAVFQRLAGRPQPLSFYVDFALANYREPETQKLLADAVTEYVAAKKHEFDQGQLSIQQLTRIRCDLKRLHQSFPKITAAELTVQKLIAYLEQGQPAMKTYNNRRGIVSTFLKHAFHRGWIVENPIAKVPHHRIRRKRGVAQTLTADQAAAFMEKMEAFEGGRWVPYFALCLFAGIRPSVPGGEITRLKSKDIDLDAGVISISAEVSKIREPRKVGIHPNLAAWLRAYPLSRFKIIIPNGQQRRSRIAQAHGLTHDVLRHTFSGLLTHRRSAGVKKARFCAQWLEDLGFCTSISERRFDARTVRTDDEPGIALCGFDNAESRALLEGAGFGLVVEAGLGGTIWNFDKATMNVFPNKLKTAAERWRTMDAVKPEQKPIVDPNGRCGELEIAEDGKAVSTSFVGGMIGAIAVSELLRTFNHGTRFDQISFNARCKEDWEAFASTVPLKARTLSLMGSVPAK